VDADGEAKRLLVWEAHAILSRLSGIQSFVLQEVMVPAASVSPEAIVAIESHLGRGLRGLRAEVLSFLEWLEQTAAPADQAQQRLTVIRLRFNALLGQLDIFNDALVQRSEARVGVWLAGLDVAASDALAWAPGINMPPVICYLDRGAGAAIRRARTRLPGGGANPVAIIRVPRERMLGIAIASSLIHEVGHQAAALLNLVESVRSVLRTLARGARQETMAWRLWDRWISEILADFWAVARLGIGGSIGLMAVLSLPRPFMFRISMNDPHPAPWIRLLELQQ
jgi:hypothetical protein